MERFRFDVVVIGCGPAGATAAVTLARAGLSVLVLEAGRYPGAENWSGCVYFTENISDSEAFGQEALLSSPFERAVSRRGFFFHNGLDLVGVSYQDRSTFQNSYTVLRPVFDPYWANLARFQGAMVISGVTATSLIRKDNRVIGVNTEIGPVHAGVVFLAEGDASHLIRSERLEKVSEPHFLQGVKAVLNLPASVIEDRFDLFPGEGCGYEYIIRNGLMGGRTARLNIGAFLYTNKNSLSFGYVVPLRNLAENFRGEHDRILEWIRNLPHFKSLLQDTRLGGYGAKLIRMGGKREQPVLVEDGLAVGGSPTGLGIDLPYPNFTGPASASGLFFARAVRELLKDGKPLSRVNLNEAYLEPLQKSVYGANASFLSQWPDFMEKTPYFFGGFVDLVCGSAHFLTEPRSPWSLTGRFLRSFLNLKTARVLVGDTFSMVKASGIMKTLTASVGPRIFLRWIANVIYMEPKTDMGLSISILIADSRSIANRRFPWPFESMIRRLSPGIAQAMKSIYTNDNTPLEKKFREAFYFILKRIKITDFITLPLTLLALSLIGLGSAIRDSFRYYILRRPAEEILSGPVHEYTESQRRARDISLSPVRETLESKLAGNSYQLGTDSHIRVFWPDEIEKHGDISQSPLWTICPAKVYQYETPLIGRGRIGVNFENCIKCESCWHSDEQTLIWGRHTRQRIIYRPVSDSMDILIKQKLEEKSPNPPSVESFRLFLNGEKPGEHRDQQALALALVSSADSVLRGIRAFETAVSYLPNSPDRTRRSWVEKVAQTMDGRLESFNTTLKGARLASSGSSGSPGQKTRLPGHGEFEGHYHDFKAARDSNNIFHVLTTLRKLKDEFFSDLVSELSPLLPEAGKTIPRLSGFGTNLEKSGRLNDKTFQQLFPERVVKEWEDRPIPENWKIKFFNTIEEWVKNNPGNEGNADLIQGLSYIDPALGLLAAHHAFPYRVLGDSPKDLGFRLCAADASGLETERSDKGIFLTGDLSFVPLAMTKTLLLVMGKEGWILPLDRNGIQTVPEPSIGFRAAGFSRISFTKTFLKGRPLVLSVSGEKILSGFQYGNIALGSIEYLVRRAKEHSLARVQFSNQMVDTQGRNGIAKLGAVKSLIARSESWRILLEVLSGKIAEFETTDPPDWLEALVSALSAMAFSPDSGRVGYDAGQVFGGMAYSEDDLLSRGYRDSAVFPFLKPGLGAAERLLAVLGPVFQKDRFPGSEGVDPDLPGEGIFGELKKRWQDLRRNWVSAAGRCPEENSGEALALLAGTFFVIGDVFKKFESGFPIEGEFSACRILLDFSEDRISDMVAWINRATPVPILTLPEIPEGSLVPLPLSYEQICGAPNNEPAIPGEYHYRSGDFLWKPFNPVPRFVPEIQLHDPLLRERLNECTQWFRERFWGKTFEGLPIERYVEKIHGIPADVLPAFRSEKFFSTIVPEEMDGEDWWKAEYYILTTAAGHFGDAGLLLVIMASTSIGTTPVLLGLEKEIPLAEEELDPLSRNPDRLGEIGDRLERLVASLQRPDPRRMTKEFTELMELVEKRIRKTRVAKYLAANFLKAFYAAGIAGRRRDFPLFSRELKNAHEKFKTLGHTIKEAIAELPRRTRGHQFFLKQLSHGGISAFALTEPTAGSDTGGVKTTARPKTVPLIPMEDGRYRFYPSNEPNPSEETARYLIDADRIKFTAEMNPVGMEYTTPSGLTSPIFFDEYQYDTDQGFRYFRLNGEKLVFHDIAQIRHKDGEPVYDFYELNGAKMWITNGRVATQFCLYAQSPEGVTGFMVDRHAEGLKIGADERKMGQRGSPTNEIAIDEVRVPKECLIGYEGHGQVNALETLNVGRCGLAVASITIIRKLILETRDQVPAGDKRDRLLGEASAILFGSESVAFHLVGLFDHYRTESVRMESAIAKYLTSEDLHEVLSLVEKAFGPPAATEKHIIEKLRRDSRILNIYEGTNEVQRFLILKDLISGSNLSFQNLRELDFPKYPSLHSWKKQLKAYCSEVSAKFGDSAWMDAALQPTFFPLADMAGEIFRLDCTLYRMKWLNDNIEALGEETIRPFLSLGKRALERCEDRLARISTKYSRTRAVWTDNQYSPETVLADTALEKFEGTSVKEAVPLVAVDEPLRVLCLLRVVGDMGPAPRIKDDQLAEYTWKLNPPDEAALSRFLSLKEASPDSFVIHAVMAGPPGFNPIARRILGSAVDSVYRMEGRGSNLGASFAEAVKELEKEGPYDLILSGADSEDGNEPLSPFLSGALDRPFLTAETFFSVNGTSPLEFVFDSEGSFRLALKTLRKEGRILAWKGPFNPLPLNLSRLIKGNLGEIPVLKPSGSSANPEDKGEVRFTLLQGTGAGERTVAGVPGAAEYIIDYIKNNRSSHDFRYEESIPQGSIPDEPGQWAILDAAEPKTIPAVVGAASILSQSLNQRPFGLVIGPEKSWAETLGIARARGLQQALCISVPEGKMGEDNQRKLMSRFCELAAPFGLIVSPGWRNSLFWLAGRNPNKGILAFSDLTEINRRGGLWLQKSAYGGKLRRSLNLQSEGFTTLGVSVSAAASFPKIDSVSKFSALKLSPHTFPISPDLFTGDSQEDSEDLTAAETIIDIGYGVKDGTGLDLVKKLKSRLEGLGLSVSLGATRKVTQDLKLLPLEKQIGQTGVRVNPKLILALGISGAPQHMDYIGERTVILAFNKDPGAPLMKFNENRPFPLVYPVVGDIFKTIPELIGHLERKT